MTDPRAKFEDALHAFATPGNRWGGVSLLTYWGAACGMDVEAVIGAAHGVGVTNRDADIRRGMVTATATVQANAAKFGIRSSGGSVRRFVRTTPAAPKPQPTDRVRRLIADGQDIDTPEKLARLSQFEMLYGEDETHRMLQAQRMLLLLFDKSEWVHIRRDKTDNHQARPCETIRRMVDWLFYPREYGEIVRPNPFTGNQGLTGDGKPSFTCLKTIAAFRHMVFEFDEMPIDDQCRFWAGVIRRGALPLVCLTHSGGKSIHGIVRVDAPDAGKWAEYRAAIVQRYASDPDKQYRLDAQALNALTGCRLAGTVRCDTSKCQQLLYDCGKTFSEW